jgi:hypothetical protein
MEIRRGCVTLKAGDGNGDAGLDASIPAAVRIGTIGLDWTPLLKLACLPTFPRFSDRGRRAEAQRLHNPTHIA